MSSLALARDTDVGAVVLDVVQGMLNVPGVRVDARVIDGTIDRTIDGSSTLSLTLEDPRRDLLRSGTLSYTLDLEVDGQWWRLVQVSKSGATLALTFEDRIVSWLRLNWSPRKASSTQMTRAEFILSLVQEIKAGGGIPFVCPQLHVKQPVAIESSTNKVTPAQRSVALGQGLAAGQKLTIKGAPANADQLANAERVLDVANSLKASDRATVALLEACTVESLFTNPTTPSADGYGSRGILQVRDVTGSAMHISNTDIEQCANAFLTRGFTGAGGAIVLAAKNPSWTTGQVAQAVQGSAYPGRYDLYLREALTMLTTYKGEPAGAKQTTFTSTAITKANPVTYQRGGTTGAKETSWDCMQRLAGEVNWRCFVVDGRLYYASETTLLQQKPQLIISEDVLGIDGIDFDIDNGKENSDVTITARASRWGVDPGSVVELYDCGPADGRWLVKEVSRGLFDAEATITLKRVTVPLPEKPDTTATAATNASQPFGQTPGLGMAGGSPVARAWAAATAITAKRYPYVWGGGHAHCGTPDHGQSGHADSAGTIVVAGVGYDCSGSTCAVLASAEMGYTLGAPADVSGTIAAKWGEPGEGQYLTVWANPDHVFMIFHTPQGDKHFGTGFLGKSWSGPGFSPELHTTAGFTPRHWKGS
jgi:hypothetical protein